MLTQVLMHQKCFYVLIRVYAYLYPVLFLTKYKAQKGAKGATDNDV
jgi:hypothetical protein